MRANLPPPPANAFWPTTGCDNVAVGGQCRGACRAGCTPISTPVATCTTGSTWMVSGSCTCDGKHCITNEKHKLPLSIAAHRAWLHALFFFSFQSISGPCTLAAINQPGYSHFGQHWLRPCRSHLPPTPAVASNELASTCGDEGQPDNSPGAGLGLGEGVGLGLGPGAGAGAGAGAGGAMSITLANTQGIEAKHKHTSCRGLRKGQIRRENVHVAFQAHNPS